MDKKGLRIFGENGLVEPSTVADMYEVRALESLAKTSMAVMPDGHIGKGAIIGSVFKYTDMIDFKIIPNIVGVDINCGMLAYKFDSDVTSIDFEYLDKQILAEIPNGMTVHASVKKAFPMLDKLIMPCEKDYYLRSLGTLGGGEEIATMWVNSLQL